MKYTAIWRTELDSAHDLEAPSLEALQAQVKEMGDDSETYTYYGGEPNSYLYRVTDQHGRVWYSVDPDEPESEEHGSSYENPPCAKCFQPLQNHEPMTWECDNCGRIVGVDGWVIKQGNNPEDPECPNCGADLDLLEFPDPSDHSQVEATCASCLKRWAWDDVDMSGTIEEIPND